MSKTVEIRIPSNSVRTRQCVRQPITVEGSVFKNAAFYFYPKRNLYRVSLRAAEFGSLLIGQGEGGKWEAVQCSKVAPRRWESSGVQSKPCNSAKDAFLNVVGQWAVRA